MKHYEKKCVIILFLKNSFANNTRLLKLKKIDWSFD